MNQTYRAPKARRPRSVRACGSLVRTLRACASPSAAGADSGGGSVSAAGGGSTGAAGNAQPRGETSPTGLMG